MGLTGIRGVFRISRHFAAECLSLDPTSQRPVMETRKQTHPTPRQLAAFALGKLTPESRGRMQEHLADCDTCSTFLSKTPRDTLVTLLRQAAAGIPASDQSTPGVRDSSTFSGLTPSNQVSERGAPGPKPPSAPSAPRGTTGAEKGSSLEDLPQALREQTKYRIVRLLGRGGMGSVYEAFHERMGRRVAIKVINPALVDHAEALKRFDQEVRAAAQVEHDNIARAYDAEEVGNLRILVMEFVPGQSLDRYLAKNGPLPVGQACRVMQQAMAGLNDAHKRGMVHRDLKPQNLMVTPEGKVKILDFGLAKLASEHRPGGGLTRENALMGTPQYLSSGASPRRGQGRHSGRHLQPRLYVLLPTRWRRALHGRYGNEGAACASARNAASADEVRPDVPQALSDLVDRMVAKNPAARPQTPAEVARALLPFAKGEVSAPPVQTAAQPSLLDEVLAEESARSTQPIPRPKAKSVRIPAVKILGKGMGFWAPRRGLCCSGFWAWPGWPACSRCGRRGERSSWSICRPTRRCWSMAIKSRCPAMAKRG